MRPRQFWLSGWPPARTARPAAGNLDARVLMQALVYRDANAVVAEATGQKWKMAEIEKERAQDTFREGLFVRALGRPCSANP